ncbi:MAG: lipopolysaccharide kinase InaA family protein [Deltaproteobacteria bacterium]|jgi:hypothetical protein
MNKLSQVVMRKVSSGPYRGMVIVDSSLDHFLQSDGEPGALFHHSGSLLKSSSSSRSALVNPAPLSGNVGLNGLYVKEFHYKGAVHSLKHLFGKHRAQVMWQVSLHLLVNGIPVAKPEGYLLELRGPFCVKGWFVSRALQRCFTLGSRESHLEILTKGLAHGGLIEVLAANVAAMHNSGVTHGDLKWTNILINEKENQLWLTDLDASKIYRGRLGPKRIARDLARFVLSGLEAGVEEAIMENFLDQYAGHRKLSRERIDGPTTRILKKLRDRHAKKYQDDYRRGIGRPSS